MDKKFNINGREVPYYQLSHKEMLGIYTNPSTSDEDKEFIENKIINAFTYNLVPKDGEDNDDVFARFFSNFVNGKCCDKKKVASLMAQDHRYLQQEMFKVFLEYVKKLDEAYQNGWYDARNEWACTAAHHMLDGLKSADYPY